MERLTIKEKNGYALKLNNPQSDSEAREQLMAQYIIAVNKLAQLENIMDHHKIENLQELNVRLISEIQLTNALLKTEDEFELLTNRWEAFKKWIADTKALRGTSTYFLQETLLEKMQELEKEE